MKLTDIKLLKVTVAMEQEETFFKDWIEAYAMHLFDSGRLQKDLFGVVGIDIYGSPIQSYYTEIPLPQKNVLDWVKDCLIAFPQFKVFVRSRKYMGIIYPRDCGHVLTGFLHTYQINFQFDTSVINRNIDFTDTVKKYYPNFLKIAKQ